jgi:molybdopterin/thiamine biosynthesis adenylyltransferase
LKDVFWERSGAELRLVRDAQEQLRLNDPDGLVELLLDLLCKGSRTPPELAEVLGVPVAAVERIINVLDRHRLVVDDERQGRASADERDRYADGLAFFEPYATLTVGREDMLERLRAAHVLALGLGGVNAAVVAHLAGLGIDRLTMVDAGFIGVRDLGRQHFARLRDVGTRTVQRAAAWIRDIEPSMHVDAVDVPVAGAAALAIALDRYCPDLVVVDAPTIAGAVGTDDVDAWVNAACVAAGVPFVRAGAGLTGATVYSVDPGRSACVACAATGPASGQVPSAIRLVGERPSAALRISPVTAMLGSLAAFEALRYLTDFEPPACAGQPVYLDFAAGGAMRRLAWHRNPDCPVCTAAAMS